MEGRCVGRGSSVRLEAGEEGRTVGRGAAVGWDWDGSVEESDREVGRLLDRSKGVARSNGFVPRDRDA